MLNDTAPQPPPGSAIVVWELFFGMAVSAFSGSPVALLSRLVLGAVLSGAAFGSVVLLLK